LSVPGSGAMASRGHGLLLLYASQGVREARRRIGEAS